MNENHILPFCLLSSTDLLPIILGIAGAFLLLLILLVVICVVMK